METSPNRYDRPSDYQQVIPVHVVWETTLACNLNCQHCGSRAGKRRPDELTLEQCYDVVRHLAALGTREITLIGGEVFLRPDWLELIAFITAAGIDCSMQTGAFNLNEKRITQAKEAGIKNIGVSIDGVQEMHDVIRGKANSFAHAVNALKLLRKHEIVSSVNTVITQTNKDSLEELFDVLLANGVRNWQVQLTVAMGNAVDNDHLLIQPYQVKAIQDRLFALYERGVGRGLLIQPGNNIGYYGPYESRWRQGDARHWNGCSAGHTLLGIEADGKIKGCPSLPSTEYTGGNVKSMSLADIWHHSEQLAFTRYRDPNELWGFCKTCYYADVCSAGCTWTSHVLFGRRGNNPFCYHRIDALEQQGLRERVVKTAEGPGLPFDHGKFKIEVVNARDEVVETQEFAGALPPAAPQAPQEKVLRQPIELALCRNCSSHVKTHETTCPFCAADVQAAEMAYQENMALVRASYEKLAAILDRLHPVT